ncbi:hypothetical protein [Thermoanaerobacterium sp. DL9XJH110]|uniref:hypothetical protein n=1 Tax=Thermoanaerobacterium sp. DL9XJH110 TaxID=3386643 RepID=UPI003BB70D04
MPQNILERIEWEVLRDKIIIQNLTSLGGLPKGSQRIEVWRDESYKIKAKVYGTVSNNDEHSEFEKGIAGTKVPTFTVEGTDATGLVKYTLNHCFVRNIQKKFVWNGEGYVTNFEAELATYELKIQYSNREQSDWHVEWFLNGPDDFEHIFPRTTKRSFSQTFVRERLSVDGESKNYSGGVGESYNRDFAFIDAGKIKYILSKVPKGLGPEWSNNIGIEYRREWGGIPDRYTREAIAEITSFIIGKHLLNIGYSTFDSMGQPIEQVALNPWGDNVISLSRSPGLSPIRFSFSDFNRIEKVLNQVVPRYLELRNVLNLNEALWRYWISNDLPIGANLPILHAGVEILAKAWFKSNKSKTKGVYLSKKEFDELIEDGMKIIVTKLQRQKYGDRMIRKISDAYKMTQNEQLAFFFEEIGLNIGEVENEALKGRNIMAHGSSSQSDEEISYLIYLTRSYQTLFHRIFLKILGYTENYIDYSTEGWPERHIDEPLGGNK